MVLQGMIETSDDWVRPSVHNSAQEVKSHHSPAANHFSLLQSLMEQMDKMQAQLGMFMSQRQAETDELVTQVNLELQKKQEELHSLKSKLQAQEERIAQLQKVVKVQHQKLQTKKKCKACLAMNNVKPEEEEEVTGEEEIKEEEQQQVTEEVKEQLQENVVPQDNDDDMEEPIVGHRPSVGEDTVDMSGLLELDGTLLSHDVEPADEVIPSTETVEHVMAMEPTAKTSKKKKKKHPKKKLHQESTGELPAAKPDIPQEEESNNKGVAVAAVAGAAAVGTATAVAAASSNDSSDSLTHPLTNRKSMQETATESMKPKDPPPSQPKTVVPIHKSDTSTTTPNTAAKRAPPDNGQEQDLEKPSPAPTRRHRGKKKGTVHRKQTPLPTAGAVGVTSAAASLAVVKEEADQDDMKPAAVASMSTKKPQPGARRKNTPFPTASNATTTNTSTELAAVTEEESSVDDGDKKPKALPTGNKSKPIRKQTPYPPASAKSNTADSPALMVVTEEEEDESVQHDHQKPMASPAPVRSPVATLEKTPTKSTSPRVGIQPSNHDVQLIHGQSLTVPPAHVHVDGPPLVSAETQVTLDSGLVNANNTNPTVTQETRRIFIHPPSDVLSIGSTTVATSTYHEERQNLVNQTLLDPHGEYGSYTGTILVSTGMPHGLGKMTYESDGRTYEGDWRHGMWHGFGKAIFGNGDSYEGEYRFDQRHGRGFYQWTDGRQYDGEFNFDKRHGKGSFNWPDGSTYQGDFCQGQREGDGIYTFVDGGHYKGHWVDGFYNGYGECFWSDGRCYKGEWKQGMAHGRGVEAYSNGSIRHDGMWENDDPIET